RLESFQSTSKELAGSSSPESLLRKAQREERRRQLPLRTLLLGLLLHALQNRDGRLRELARPLRMSEIDLDEGEAHLDVPGLGQGEDILRIAVGQPLPDVEAPRIESGRFVCF